MSTRATYSFEGTKDFSIEPNITIYIHHDGYPEGAATYFWNLYHVENHRGGKATQFIRANDGAEITNNHEGHGDTEFRYKFKDDYLTAYKLTDWAKGKWEVFFTGDYREFVNQYGAKSFMDRFERIEQIEVGGKQRWSTKTELIKKAEQADAEYKKKLGDGCKWNMDSLKKDVEDLTLTLAIEFDYTSKLND